MSRMLHFAAVAPVAAATFVCALSAQSSQGGKPPREIRFEILSLKPIQPGAALSAKSDPTLNGFTARLSLWQLIMLAFTADAPVAWAATQLKNAPNWIGDFYDIDARVSQSDLQAWQHQGPGHELLRSALRTALRERCKLAIHEEASQAEMFDLILAKGGPHLKPSAAGGALPRADRSCPAVEWRSDRTRVDGRSGGTIRRRWGIWSSF